MRNPVDLALLRDGFFSLSQTPYFNRRLNDVASDVVGAMDVVIGGGNTLDSRTTRSFARALWNAHRYLAGSTVSESPYEIEYCLRAALFDWVSDECVFATTLTAQLDFHFCLLDIGRVIDTLVNNYTRQCNVQLIPIALPRLYKNRPLYCAPLYHELGHFIDRKFGVVELSLLRFPSTSGLPYNVEKSHRAEFFSDLFAAQYVGDVAAKSLEQIALDSPASATHPATQERVAKISAFLSGSPDQLVDQFSQVLGQLNLSPLSVRHIVPNISSFLDDIRPAQVNNVAELHGLYPAFWGYLDSVEAQQNSVWANRGRTFPEVDKAVNDLLEKSIRNHAIKEKWNAASN